MSASALPLGSLPPVNQALEPAWVRNGSETVKQDYEEARSFEATLVEQLSHSLTASAGSEGEEGGEGGASSEQLSATLPQALSTGVLGGGGLGLAEQLTRDLVGRAGRSPSEGSATVSPSGGVTGSAR